MTYTDKYGEFFGRFDEHGNVVVLHVEGGEAATRLDASVYPVVYGEDVDGRVTVKTADLSARYEHAAGITLLPDDARRIGLISERNR